MKKRQSNLKKTKQFITELESTPLPLSEYEIAEKIKNFIKENFSDNIPAILKWEKMGFDFQENYSDNKPLKSNYFRPKYICSEDNFAYPDRQKVTQEIVNYWEKRSGETNNPIMKARYSSLVIDFYKTTNKKFNYIVAQRFIDSVIEIANNDYHKIELNVIKLLSRALSIALSINDKNRVNILKNTIINYEKKIAQDTKPNLWGFAYEFLLKNQKNKNIKLSKEQKDFIIKELENRFYRLIKTNDIWATEKTVTLLIDYYNKSKNKEKTRKILVKFGKMVQKQQMSALASIEWLRKLQHLFSQNEMQKEAKEMLKNIKNYGKQIHSEMQKKTFKIEIEKSDLEKCIEQLTAGDLETALHKITVYFLPKKNNVKQQIDKLSREFPVSFLFKTKLVDSERVIATIGSLQDDIEGNIIQQISQNLLFSSFLLEKTLNTLINKFNLTAEQIVKYLYQSPIFLEKRKEFFLKGIDAYLKKDFLISLHLLIPQIEETIRKLAEKIGIPILNPSQNDGFLYRTLNNILCEKEIIKILSEDVSLYFRILLTDQRGWNIRNNLCHGLCDMECFDNVKANRVFHLLLVLALVK